MALANSPLEGVYVGFLDTPVEVRIGAFEIAKPLLLWINDGLMAVFFFLVGLELKREALEGELSSLPQVILPALAAAGGMAAPAAIYAWINRGDPLLGWDTDQFPNDITESAIVLYILLKSGGFTSGGMNFDAKIRRPSIDPEDLFHAHIGGLDTLARGLLIAEKMINDGKLEANLRQRYAGWDRELGQRITSGKTSLADLSKHVLDTGLEPRPKSGRQEYLENLVNRYL